MSYSVGDLVYYPQTINAHVFMSLTNGNTTTPSLVPPDYSATVYYSQGDFVTSAGLIYESIWPASDNIGNTPATSASQWRLILSYADGTIYASSDLVLFSGILYISLAGSNIGHSPPVSPTFWRVYQPAVAIGSWLLLDASLLSVVTPMPLNQGQAIYPLPANYLRECAQNPKDGSYSLMGAPTNAGYTDWLFEGQFIISKFPQPITTFRFIADLTDPAQFDPMFVEGFAGRIAEEVCPVITQSEAKLASITKAYDKVMGEARLVNSIEIGSEEAPLDDYLSSRF